MQKEKLKEKLLNTNYFKDNKWLDKYCKLIESNNNIKIEKDKTQTHHIIPQCYYKLINQNIDNSKENKINLLYKDHILAHYYLCLSCKEKLKYKLEYAFFYMLGNQYYINKYKLNNMSLLEDIKEFKDGLYEDYCKRQSDKLKGRVLSPESIEKAKISRNNRTPEQNAITARNRSNSMKGKNKGPRSKEIIDKIKIYRKNNPLVLSEESNKIKSLKFRRPLSDQHKNALKKSHDKYKIYCKELGIIFENMDDVVNYLLANNLSSTKHCESNINKCCCGDSKSSYGYNWYKIPKNITLKDIETNRYILKKIDKRKRITKNYENKKTL